MFRHFFTIAWRNIIRNKLYAGINILGLSLGVCSCIVIWLVYSFEISFDKFHPDGDRIYRVVQGGKPGEQKDPNIIPPMPAAMRAGIPGLENVTTYFAYNQSREVKVPGAGRPATTFQPRMQGSDWHTGFIIADADWFHVFSYQWLAGNPSVALKEPFQVVLTESAAKQYFGDVPLAAVMGRELLYEDSLHVRVSGVVRDWTENSDLAYTDIISFPTIEASFLKERRHMDDWIPHQGVGRWYWPYAYVKLARGAETSQIEAQINKIAAQHISTPKGHPWLQALQPLRDVHFNSDYNDNRRKAHLPTLYGLSGIAIFILILAAVNYINLATAQSLQRAREIGVRKVLGSSRRGLVIQFLAETGGLTMLASVIAILLISPAMQIFQDYIPVGVRFNPWTPGNMLFLLGITLSMTILAGYYPAKVLASYQPVQTLKGSGAIKGGEKWWLRRSLIVFQFTISLVFIIVTLVIGNQIRFMLNTDYGFRTDAMVTVQGQGNMLDTTLRKIQLLKQRYTQLPGIAEVIQEATPPIGWGRTTLGFQYKGKQINDFALEVKFGDERFIPFYGMHILAGRNIHRSDSLVEVVINETAAKQLGFREASAAVGEFLYSDKKALPIVGVVADFHAGSFQEAIQPLVIGHNPVWERDLGIKLASKNQSADKVKATLHAMEKIYKEIYPGTSFPCLFMDDSIRDLYETEQKTASLIRVAMGLAIFISCMGLFGLSLFMAERRAGEIGIRKVLGATAADIALMLNKDIVALVLLALMISSPIAWLLARRWLQDFAYRVPIDAWVFVIAGSSAITIALVTVSVQSIRAAIANPVKILHME